MLVAAAGTLAALVGVVRLDTLEAPVRELDVYRASGGVGARRGEYRLRMLDALAPRTTLRRLAIPSALLALTLAVLAAFLIILLRGLRLYWSALDEFGRYLAVGITVSIVLQAFVNMSVAVDLGPTKGIPLPLVSYGGSSLVSSMIMLGLLLNVSQRAR